MSNISDKNSNTLVKDEAHIPWKIVSSDLVYQDPWMALHKEKVKFDGIEELGSYAVIKRHSFSAVVPITASGNIVCIRTIRHATRLASLEIPMGFNEEGENPELGASRELEEETGWKAGELHSTGWHFPSPSFMTQKCFSFVAKHLTPGTVHLDAHEHLTVEELSPEYVLRAIQTGEISDAPTIIALLKAKQQGFL